MKDGKICVFLSTTPLSGWNEVLGIDELIFDNQSNIKNRCNN